MRTWSVDLGYGAVSDTPERANVLEEIFLRRWAKCFEPMEKCPEIFLRIVFVKFQNEVYPHN